ncbi:DUF1360 domain-containing protein [Fervidibacillus albus]|uniref:DUF1360 domain-containing protein n=1 Tax=Fervidibacillus albus TaxID=2980026 RepID=A0A9E8LX52_9BACI|nr:DUF1360 domain-containing protein [Fervidibacillus albus]WAA11292.1 DUF1360 domain-containing protein [Fervidibacillus albus]
MELNMEIFVLLVLASFRLTRLIVFDKITEFLRRPFMDEVTEVDENGDSVTFIVPKSKGLRKWMGELLSCYWCTGIWTSAILLFILYVEPTVATPVIVILAIAGAAAIIETVVGQILGE